MKEDFVGLTEIKNQILECGDCGVELVDVVLTEHNSARQDRNLPTQKSQFKVTKCYKCGGSSFKSEVFEGSIALGAVKDGVLIDVQDTDVLDDGTIFTLLTTRKN